MPGPTRILRDENGTEHEITAAADGRITVADQTVLIRALGPGEVRAGERTAWTAAAEGTTWVFLDGRVYTFHPQRAGMRGSPARRHHHGGLSAPMPATVVAIPAAAGTRVRAGDPLVVLEAMKMELPVRAPSDGIVTAVRCRVGELVQPGQDLVELGEA